MMRIITDKALKKTSTMCRFRQNMEERERELIKSGIGLERGGDENFFFQFRLAEICGTGSE